MISREDRLKMFANEIGDIYDKDLKELATELIANADDYFFTVPASSSGKYHPPFDLGCGGLVRHTRCVAFMAMSIAESQCMSTLDRDSLIVAAIAHDIKKQGNGSGNHTVFEHPTYAKNYVLEIDNESLNNDKIELEKLKSELEKEENELESEIEKIAAQSVVNGEGQVISSGSWPVPGHSRISSPYGYRIHPIFNTKKMHTGIDIPAPTGTPTVSIDSGKVIFAGTKGGYGKTVMIQHDDGKVTLYAHNSALTVSVGQRVKKGQVVAKIGSTGNSTGPHLHFEVRINGKHVNPVPYIK